MRTVSSRGPDLPAWIPDELGHTGMVTADTSALQAAFGFEARPLEQTAAWVLEWISSGAAESASDGLTPELEPRILAAC